MLAFRLNDAQRASGHARCKHLDQITILKQSYFKICDIFYVALIGYYRISVETDSQPGIHKTTRESSIHLLFPRANDQRKRFVKTFKLPQRASQRSSTLPPHNTTTIRRTFQNRRTELSGTAAVGAQVPRACPDATMISHRRSRRAREDLSCGMLAECVEVVLGQEHAHCRFAP
jgi:hypothetical protein